MEGPEIKMRHNKFGNLFLDYFSYNLKFIS
jgi:hypothetical protein